MWPVPPDVPAARPIAARWPRAVALACGCTAASWVLLLTIPHAILTRWTAVGRPVRELAATVWFAVAFALVVAVLARVQRPARRGDGVAPAAAEDA